MSDRLQTGVGPADVAADPLRMCPMASVFGFADPQIYNDHDITPVTCRVQAVLKVPACVEVEHIFWRKVLG